MIQAMGEQITRYVQEILALQIMVRKLQAESQEEKPED